MDKGAKRAYRYAQEGAPDPTAWVRDKAGVWQCAPTETAEVFAAGWKELWDEAWEDEEEGFGEIPLEEIKKMVPLTGA
eukprot:14592529-Heterocapsa_arctica.AAC.1